MDVYWDDTVPPPETRRSIEKKPPSPPKNKRKVSFSSSALEIEGKARSTTRQSIFLALKLKNILTTQQDDESIRERPISFIAGTSHFSPASSIADWPTTPLTEGIKAHLPFIRSEKKSRASMRAPPAVQTDDKSLRIDRIRHRRASSAEPLHNNGMPTPLGLMNITRLQPTTSKPSAPKLSALKSVLKSPELETPVVEHQLEILEPSFAEQEVSPRKGQPPLRPKRSDEFRGKPIIRISKQSNNASPELSPPVPPKTFSAPWNTMQFPSTKLTNSASEYLASPHLYGEPRPAKELAGKLNRTNSLNGRPQLRLDKPLPPISFRPPLELVPEEPENMAAARDSFYSLKGKIMSDPELTMKSQSMLKSPKKKPAFTESNAALLDRSAMMLRSETSQNILGLTEFASDLPNWNPSMHSAEKLQEKVDLTEQPPIKVTPKSFTNIEGEWEDDIDFCYDHQAESHCDFDWRKRSLLLDDSGDDELKMNEHQDVALEKDEEAKDHESVHTSYSDVNTAIQRVHDLYSLSSTLAVDEVPDLDGNSSRSGSSSSLSTPLSADGHDSGSENDVPVQIHPSNSSLTMEQMYHYLLSGNGYDDGVDEIPFPSSGKSTRKEKRNSKHKRTSASLTPAERLTLGSMVASLRGLMESEPSSPVTDRRSLQSNRRSLQSNTTFRKHRQSRRSSGSQVRRSCSAVASSATQETLYCWTMSMESVAVPPPLCPRKSPKPDEAPAKKADSSCDSPDPADSQENPWSSTPSLVSDGHAAFTDKPSEGPRTLVRSDISARHSLVNHEPARFFQLSPSCMESGAESSDEEDDDDDDRSLSEYSAAVSMAAYVAETKAARRASTGAHSLCGIQKAYGRYSVMI